MSEPRSWSLDQHTTPEMAMLLALVTLGAEYLRSANALSRGETEESVRRMLDAARLSRDVLDCTQSDTSTAALEAFEVVCKRAELLASELEATDYCLYCDGKHEGEH